MTVEDAKLWELLVGWAAMIFGIYPMTKDLVDGQPNTVPAMFYAIIFSATLVLVVLGLFKYLKKS